MPSSFVDSVPPIIHTILDLQPARILDIGPGYGKYGLLCREYLGRQLARIDAVEVPPGRVNIQNAIYDHVYEGDVLDLKEKIPWVDYDLVLLIDVIEHMDMEQGHRLLRAIRAVGTRVLVSTPKVWEEQHDEHNPWEEHVSLWTWEDFTRYSIGADISTIDSIIYLLGPTA